MTTQELIDLVAKLQNSPTPLTDDELKVLDVEANLRRDDAAELVSELNAYGGWQSIRERIDTEVYNREFQVELSADPWSKPNRQNHQPAQSPDGRALHDMSQSELAQIAFPVH